MELRHTPKTSQVHGWTKRNAFKRARKVVHSWRLPLKRDVPKSSRWSGSDRAVVGAKLAPCAMGPLMGPDAHLEWMRNRRRVKVEETTAAVKEVGAQNFILATDLGQTGNPNHPTDGQQLFVTELMTAGLTKDQITTMGREVTGNLLPG
jgi:hypothetical protein